MWLWMALRGFEWQLGALLCGVGRRVGGDWGSDVSDEKAAGFAGEGGFSEGGWFSGGAGGSEGSGGAGWFWARKFII